MTTSEKMKAYVNTTKIILIVLGAAGLGGYSYTNHTKSAKGYEILAAAVNTSILGRLDQMEQRLDALERKTAAASQPTSAPFHIGTLILPGAPKDPHEGLRADLKAMSVAKVVVKTRPAPKDPPSPQKVQMRVPAKLKDVF